jgi:hypothetical protein
VKRNPRRSSECSSGVSSERVSFASIQRRSSVGSSHYSSGRGTCEEEPEKVVRIARLESSSERVSFASIQRRSSVRSSHYSSGRGACEEEPEKVVRMLVWIIVRTSEFCKHTETVV